MHEPARPIRILIAEDHLIARAGMGAIISAQPDMMVVAEAVNGEQAFALYRLHVPDVTLMDVRTPVMSGRSGGGRDPRRVSASAHCGAQHVWRR
jgi:CheY-like chemotaxis protein